MNDDDDDDFVDCWQKEQNIPFGRSYFSHLSLICTFLASSVESFALEISISVHSVYEAFFQLSFIRCCGSRFNYVLLLFLLLHM